MKQHLTATLAITLLAVAMASQGAAQVTSDGQDNTSINVSIASEVAIDIDPTELTYSSLSLGQQTVDSDRGFGAIELENVGSEYIDRIWANATQLTSPEAQFGTGTETDFNAGNMFQIKPDNASGLLQGDSSDYSYVNRREYATYNESQKPSYIVAPEDAQYETQGGTGNPNDVALGRIRVADQERFFAIPTNGKCNGEGSNTFNTLLVAKKAHNSTETAPVDFTSGGDFSYIPGDDYYKYNISTTDAGSSYGVTAESEDPDPAGVTIDVSGTGDREYDILTKCDTNNGGGSSGTVDEIYDNPHLIRTRYNIEAAGANNLATDSNAPVTQYLLNSQNNVDGQLPPGQAVTVDTAIEVPRGIPEGIVDSGQFRLIVTADKTST